MRRELAVRISEDLGNWVRRRGPVSVVVQGLVVNASNNRLDLVFSIRSRPDRPDRSPFQPNLSQATEDYTFS